MTIWRGLTKRFKRSKKSKKKRGRRVLFSGSGRPPTPQREQGTFTSHIPLPFYGSEGEGKSFPEVWEEEKWTSGYIRHPETAGDHI